MNREQIKEFVGSTQASQFEGVSWFQSFENNNQLTEDRFDSAKLKVLVAFLSPGPTRSVSNTYGQLDSIIRQVSDEIFVDYAYFPMKEDVDLFDKHKLPYWFGNVSKAPVQDYDIVVLSTSILREHINLFHALQSCGIPEAFEERMKDSNQPLILAGGIPVADHDAFASVDGESIVDLIYVGFAEGGFQDLLRDYMKHKGAKKSFIKKVVQKYTNLYFPAGYTVTYEKGRIVSVDPKFDWVPKNVDFHHEHDLDPFPAFERKIFNPDNSNANTADVLISAGCAGSGSCYFCVEGLVCGGWRERSFEALLRSFDEVKLYAAPNAISFYSFNSPYYSRFLDMIYEATRRFSTIKLLNLRTDIMAQCPEYFRAAVEVGPKRVSMPIEGFGERVRREVFNKSLTFEQIKQAFRNVLRYNLTECKIGMVLSGHETADDLRNAAEEFEELYRIKQEMGVGTGLRCNVTPLVFYPQTGCGWMKQNTSMISLGKMKALYPLLKRLRGKIRFKFNSQNYGTVAEQMALNLGRLGFPIWKTAAQKGFKYYSSPGKEFIQHMDQSLKDMGLDMYDFFKEKPKDWVFPVSHLVKKSPEYTGLLFKRAGKKPIEPCTRTPIRENPKCLECGYCKDQEMKDSILKRPLGSEKMVEDIQIAKFENKPLYALRMSYYVPFEKRFIGKTSWAFSLFAKILRQNPGLVDAYHSIRVVSNSSMLRGDLKDWMSGRFYCDVLFKSPVLAESLVGEDGVSFAPTAIQSRISEDIMVISLVSLRGIGASTVTANLPKIQKSVKVAQASSGQTLLFTDRALTKPVKIFAKMVDGATKMAIVHPIWANPHLILATLMGWSYKKMVPMMEFAIFGYYGQESGVCACGNAKRRNELNLKDSNICVSCIAKQSLKRF